MNSTFKWSTEQELKDVFANAIAIKMAKADWHYEYADSSYDWDKGDREIKRIISDLKLLCGIEGGLEIARALWTQHVPAYSKAEPEFLSNPELLRNPVNGVIMKQDITAVQKILETLQSEGHHFTAFKSDCLELPENRFKGFTRISDARNYVYENSTPSQHFIVSSIPALKTEIQQALVPDKDAVLKDIAERLQSYQRDNNRSAEQGISR